MQDLVAIHVMIHDMNHDSRPLGMLCFMTEFSSYTLQLVQGTASVKNRVRFPFGKFIIYYATKCDVEWGVFTGFPTKCVRSYVCNGKRRSGIAVTLSES